MSHFNYTIIIGWETRNWRHIKRAEVWCKDYGLRPILKNLHIGRVRSNDKEKLKKFFTSLFSKKTEKIFFGTFCDTCEKTLATEVREKTKRPLAFEIITAGSSSISAKKAIK